jgi:hypothetical protein
LCFQTFYVREPFCAAPCYPPEALDLATNLLIAKKPLSSKILFQKQGSEQRNVGNRLAIYCRNILPQYIAATQHNGGIAMTKAMQRNAILDGQYCLYVAFIAVDPFFYAF